LENGDRLHSREFLRRYEAMPEVKKAELVNGMVFMGSPVRADVHAAPDSLVQGWLLTYAAHTPGVTSYANATLVLDSSNTFQPDSLLCLGPASGGRSYLDPEGYLHGAPELVVEIAASSASLDLTDKLDVYQRAGVAEYLVWRTAEREFDWFRLEVEEFRPVQPDAHGILRSATFPGLDLDVQALLALNAAKVLATLQRGLKSKAHAKFTRRSAVQ